MFPLPSENHSLVAVLLYTSAQPSSKRNSYYWTPMIMKVFLYLNPLQKKSNQKEHLSCKVFHQKTYT